MLTESFANDIVLNIFKFVLLAVNWFRQNEMMGNLEKFQTVVLNKQRINNHVKLKINGHDIIKLSLKLFGINTGNELNFVEFMSFCSIAIMQLNTLNQIQNIVGILEK